MPEYLSANSRPKFALKTKLRTASGKLINVEVGLAQSLPLDETGVLPRQQGAYLLASSSTTALSAANMEVFHPVSVGLSSGGSSLASHPYTWYAGSEYRLELQIRNNKLEGTVYSYTSSNPRHFASLVLPSETLTSLDGNSLFSSSAFENESTVTACSALSQNSVFMSNLTYDGVASSLDAAALASYMASNPCSLANVLYTLASGYRNVRGADTFPFLFCQSE